MNWQKCDRCASFYDWLERRNQGRFGLDSFRRKYLENLKGKVLEIGVGGGNNFPFYSKDVQLIGVDPGSKMLELARKNLGVTKASVALQRACAERLPYPDESFDHVVSTLVLCSVDDPEKAIKEIKRVLKLKGTLVFIEHVKSHKLKNYLLQLILNPLQYGLFGCSLLRETDKQIEKYFKIIKKERIHEDIFWCIEGEK